MNFDTLIIIEQITSFLKDKPGFCATETAIGYNLSLDFEYDDIKKALHKMKKDGLININENCRSYKSDKNITRTISLRLV